MTTKRSRPVHAATPTVNTIKVYIEPHFDGPDNGEGGIRRVVEAQRRWLPRFGVEVVDSIEAADVIHSHATTNARTDKPIVTTCHGLYWSEYQWEPWSYDANRQVLDAIRQADAVTSVSRWVATAIERNCWIKPTTIYNGIDPDLWRVSEEAAVGDRELVSGGYVLYNKTRTDPICDPTPMQQLAARVADVPFITTFGNQTANVTVTGKVPHDRAKEYVAKAGVYLCTTRETMGIGTLEAMAAGVPVLGWAWGGQAEIITHKVDGWLVPPGDIAGLEEGLRYCLAHRDEMGRAARQKVKDHFTWDAIIPQYVAIYRRLLAEQAAQVKVSVVIPCYNLGRYLEDAVQSTASDPIPGGSEVIIVDDASTDDSGSLADNIAARFANVRVIHHSTNSYLAGALNSGIESAKGKYIIPLDADNMLGPNALSVMVKALDDSRRELDIVYGAMSIIDTENGNREQVSPWPNTFDYAKQMLHLNQLPSTSMYRKKVWERVGGYRRRCRTAEDADFWCRATSFGARAMRVTDAVTLRYRSRPNSMSATNADWPWHKWYAWWQGDAVRDPNATRMSPPVSPIGGPIWTYEPPKISVIIPVGPGHERLVVDAVESLVAQDFRHWECIVVNDSGTPLPWIHPFAQVITTSHHRGPAHARNAGFAVARGNTLLPLDADDYLQPGALSALYRAFTNLDPKHYVYSDFVVQETGAIKELQEYDCEDILRKLPHAVTALYPRAGWKAVGGFDEAFEGWEDWDFAIALAAKGYCGQRLALPLIQYRMRSGSRRETMYAQRETLIDRIKSKWSPYYNGEKLMACGSCGGAKTVAQLIQDQNNTLGPAQMSMMQPVQGGADMVLLEYVGLVSGPLTYRGSKTGTSYRFGLDVNNKVKYVHAADALDLLNRREFTTGTPAVELLQAKGA